MFVLISVDCTGNAIERHCKIYHDEEEAILDMLGEAEDNLLANEDIYDEERSFCETDEGEPARVRNVFTNGTYIDWFVLKSEN